MIIGEEKSDSDEDMNGHQTTSNCGIDVNEKYYRTIESKIMIISMKLDIRVANVVADHDDLLTQ